MRREAMREGGGWENTLYLSTVMYFMKSDI